MHHLAGLSSGYAQAANGTAKVYARGTSTKATYYTSFEAGASSTADVLLDSRGQAEVYVNQLVTVKLYDSAGNYLKEFVDGVNATAVEINSPSVIGTDYTDASTGVNKPTTLQAFLALWTLYSGGQPWPLVDPFDTGTGLGLAAAIGLGQGGEFNVKKYGALGDGTTNDTAAITAAIAAASAAGGGTVVFPPGTYKITAALTVPQGVSLTGVAADVSIVEQATAGVISFNYDNANLGSGFDGAATHITNLQVRASVSTTAALFHLDGGAYVFDACTLGSTNSTTNLITAGTGLTHTSAFACSFHIAAGSGSCLRSTATVASIAFMVDGCRFTIATGAYTGSIIKSQWIHAAGSIFQCLSTSGTCAGIEGIADAAPRTWIMATGNAFTAGAGAVLSAFKVADSCAARLVESANTFFGLSTTTPYSITQSVADIATGHFSLGSRVGRVLTGGNDTAGAQTVDGLSYGTILWERTTNGTQTPTLPIAPSGTRFTLVWWNNHGAGGGTITLASASGALRSEFASDQFTVAANSIRMISFVSIIVNGALRWVQDGESTDDETE